MLLRVAGGIALQLNCRFLRLQKDIGGLMSIVDGENKAYDQQQKHIVFIDLDNVSQEYIEERLVMAQKEFELSDFYLFKTGHGFHAICLDICSIGEILDIHQYIDKERLMIYDLQSLKRGNWVLRFTDKQNSKKPEYIKCIFHKGYKKISLTHASFLKYMYEIEAISEKNLPKNPKVPIVHYEATL
jgi:hypothetical protein